MTRVSILIPTRNRPEKIVKLLESIEKSSVKPFQIVVVASGQNIEPSLLRFKKNLNISYFHTVIIGQVAQKKIGINLLHKDSQWCLFLDDDLLVGEHAIESALNEANSRVQESVIGLGYSLPPTTRILNAGVIALGIGRVLQIASGEPGTVLKSGHAVSYSQAKTVIETQWLNGASMWHVSVLETYGLGLPSTPYAACEDLIFSYPLGKRGKMIYCPEAHLSFQDGELSNFDSATVFEAATFWRYYLVKNNPELSIWRFQISQIGRIIFALLNTENGKRKLGMKLIKAQAQMYMSILRRESPVDLLNRLTP
jgi:glycosyltransferase involved in cell wall biosynthesis